MTRWVRGRKAAADGKEGGQPGRDGAGADGLLSQRQNGDVVHLLGFRRALTQPVDHGAISPEWHHRDDDDEQRKRPGERKPAPPPTVAQHDGQEQRGEYDREQLD